ncbi:hypothetical protein Dimus_010574 [Dionaea muscipula]
MMIGELNRSHPTVQISPWDHYDDPAANMLSPYSPTTTNPFSSVPSPRSSLIASHDLTAASFQGYVLSANDFAEDSDDDSGLPFDSFSCDNFRMYEFKVRKCARGRSHDWTECPFAHPGEKARRRDPRKYHYSGAACPEFRRGSCRKGDSCEFAHGVFECWLHPARYRTQPCKDGPHCKRKICFFAHSPEQLRVLPQSPTSESALDLDSLLLQAVVGSSPTSILVVPPKSPPPDSPPMSPCSSGCKSLIDLVAEMRGLRIAKASASPRSMGFSVSSGFGSPRSPVTARPGYCSLPSTPNRAPTRCGLGFFDSWDTPCEEEPMMERVESGRDLRARMYAKLSKENTLDIADSDASPPDLGWVSELVK